MRFLLINNHCITDATAGVTQSLRTIMGWLAEAGHALIPFEPGVDGPPMPFDLGGSASANASAHEAVWPQAVRVLVG